jgi:hypothetical protein
VKILFNENIPLPLRRFFVGHTINAVQGEGWTGIQNGALIALADGRFDVLLLADKNLRYQQNLSHARSPWLSSPPTVGRS